MKNTSYINYWRLMFAVYRKNGFWHVELGQVLTSRHSCIWQMSESRMPITVCSVLWWLYMPLSLDPFVLQNFFGVYVNGFYVTEEEAGLVDVWGLYASCTGLVDVWGLCTSCTRLVDVWGLCASCTRLVDVWGLCASCTGLVDVWGLCASCAIPAATNLSWMFQIVTA